MGEHHRHPLFTTDPERTGHPGDPLYDGVVWVCTDPGQKHCDDDQPLVQKEAETKNGS